MKFSSSCDAVAGVQWVHLFPILAALIPVT